MDIPTHLLVLKIQQKGANVCMSQAEKQNTPRAFSFDLIA